METEILGITNEWVVGESSEAEKGTESRGMEVYGLQGDGKPIIGFF